MRQRPPPTAARTAISRSRTDALASSRFATFTQAMSSTKSTAPNNTSNVVRDRPTISSWSDSTAIRKLWFVSGNSRASRLAITLKSAAAWLGRTPGLSRPTAFK